MRTFLKIKIKSLADEAVTIKQEEAKWKYAPYTEGNLYYTHPMFFKLRHHRIHEVRAECRAATIAYGYMRGRAYHQIENKCHEQPNWARVEQIIAKFSGDKYLATNDRKQLNADLKVWASLEYDLPEPKKYAAFEAAKEMAQDVTQSFMDMFGAMVFGK